MNPLLHGSEPVIAIIFKSGFKLSDLDEILSEEQRQMKMIAVTVKQSRHLDKMFTHFKSSL